MVNHKLMPMKEIQERIIELAEKVHSNALKDDKERKRCQDVAQKILLGLEEKSDNEQKLYQFNKDKGTMDAWCARSYFSYQIICQQLKFELDSNKTNEFISLFFPKPLNKRQTSHCSYLISFVMPIRNTILLDCLTQYIIECDTISFPSQPMALELARDSPKFCAAIISKGYFIQHQTGKDNLTAWLETLINLLPNESINLNHAIRYSFNEKAEDYHLHMAILNMIKHKKCQPLNNHFLNDLATTVSGRNDKKLKDRFDQILVIAFANKMCSQSNQLKNILKDKFSNDVILLNEFIK